MNVLTGLLGTKDSLLGYIVPAFTYLGGYAPPTPPEIVTVGRFGVRKRGVRKPANIPLAIMLTLLLEEEEPW